MTRSFHWGTALALAYGSFVAVTIAFVVFALGRPVSLVRPDYYAASLQQDQRAEAIANASALGSAVSLTNPTGRRLRLALPREHAVGASGTITLYRASDPAADRIVDLAVDTAGRQDISLDGMAAGQWVAQARWRAGGREFYLETPVVAR